MERRRKAQRPRYRGCPEILRASALALPIALGISDGAAADAAAVRISARYDARVAHVETIGTLFNGTQDVGAGSGLLIGDTFVLTNNHVIPPENNYKQLDIFVRLKSRLTNPIAVSSVQRDPGHDLALLQLAKPTSADAGGPRCPMPVIVQDTLAPMGTSIYLLGYPLDQDLSLSGGLISNHGDGSRWQTDTVMNSGNSGGPAFEEHGSLVGIAVGGIVKWTFGGETHNVNGVNFLIPTSVIVASPVFKPVLDLPNDRRCWVDASTAISFALPPPIAQSARLNRTYTVNETKDDHPVLLASHSRTYDKPFAAEPGYRIVGCNWRAESANHANDITCNIAAGGASATFSFRLESGPQVDQWRGWWAGSVTVSQALSTAQ